MADILILEDDITFTQILSGFLKKHDHQVDIRHTIKEGENILKEKVYQLVLLDYKLPDGLGTDLLKRIRTSGQKVPVIMMTSFHDIRIAVNAIKLGALDYITKPINPDELMMIVNQTLRNSNVIKKIPPQVNQFVRGESEISKQLVSYIDLVAPTNMAVLIQGESGTGKEQIARTIHNQSTRAKGPFIAIDCGALSTELANSELFGHVKGAFTGAVQDKKGQFEYANKGTLFLDEIGNLNYDIQVKLLRILQERVLQPIGGNQQVNVDVRIIAATNDDLTTSIKNKSFREDLYHRLNEFKITVPALRERGDDLKIFVKHFIELSNYELERNVKNVSTEVMRLFEGYDWPGNLRELKNLLKRAVLLSTGDIIEKYSLPAEMIEDSIEATKTNKYDLKIAQETIEREIILKTMLDVKFNKSKAARLLNIDRKTLYLKLEKYKIEI